MCDLYGISSSLPGRAVSGLHRFAEHSRRNPHGWGIAYYIDGEAVLKKMPERAAVSKPYFQVVEEAESDVIISHIRHASRGEKHELNCHPFAYQLDGRHWVFAHNGHVDGIGRHTRALGETDSESVFHMLLDSLSDQADVVSGLKYGITSLFEEYEFGRQIKLNFLLSDGTKIYAFSHHPEKPVYYRNSLFGEAAQTTVSTQVLDSDRWERLPWARLLVVSQGQVEAITGEI